MNLVNEERYIHYPKKKPENKGDRKRFRSFLQTQKIGLPPEYVSMQNYAGVESYAQVHAANTPEELKDQTHLATEYLSQLRSKFGFLELKTEPQVIYLTRDNFNELITTLGKSDPNEMAAAAIYPLKPVLVVYDSSFPLHILSAIAFHELVHRWFDLHVTVFTLGESTLMGRLKFKYVRSGLQININNGGTELLNELGNSILEVDFLHYLLAQPLNNTLLNERNSVLERIIGENDQTSQVVRIATKSGMLFFDPKNVFFDSYGDNLIYSEIALTFFQAQIVDNIDYILRTVGEMQSLKDLLVQAKINPEVQNKIRKILDAIFKKGFFYNLKRTKNSLEGLIPLLLMTQKKRQEYQPEWK